MSMNDNPAIAFLIFLVGVACLVVVGISCNHRGYTEGYEKAVTETRQSLVDAGVCEWTLDEHGEKVLKARCE